MESYRSYKQVTLSALLMAGLCLNLCGCTGQDDDQGLSEATTSIGTSLDQQNKRHGIVTIHATEPISSEAAIQAAKLAAFHNPQMTGLPPENGFDCVLQPQEQPLDYTVDCTGEQ